MFDEEHKECNSDCAAKEALDLYLSSGNPEKVWKMLCPDKDEWTNDLSILQNLGADLLSEKFFQPLSYVKGAEKVTLAKTLFCLDVESALEAALSQDGISAEFLKDNTVIPTLMNLSDRKKGPICKKLDSLYKNHEAKFAFSGHVITAKEENGDLLTKQWSHEQIIEAWQQRIRDSDELEKDKEEKHKIIVEKKFETFKQKYEEKERFLNKVLLSRFNDAVKDYNSDVLAALRLPVFLYSGKILQNYPLGLGIRLEVNKTQLVFRGSDRDDKDVYNLLSTGQLNGLAISVLLAVHDVCRKKHELELLMIDDPLQTMDEISSISLADMLASSVTGQIILSTHENSNADLIWYKFKQMGRRVVDIDMQKKYLKFNKN